MMQPVTPHDANSEYAKPINWDEAKDGPCGVLSIRRVVVGTPETGARLHLYSNWKPNSVELAELNAGAVVELLCVGIQPPVAVGVVRLDDPKPQGVSFAA